MPWHWKPCSSPTASKVLCNSASWPNPRDLSKMGKEDNRTEWPFVIDGFCPCNSWLSNMYISHTVITHCCTTAQCLAFLCLSVFLPVCCLSSLRPCQSPSPYCHSQCPDSADTHHTSSHTSSERAEAEKTLELSTENCKSRNVWNRVITISIMVSGEISEKIS